MATTTVNSRPPLVNDGQEYALVVMVGPEHMPQKSKQFAFQVLGCFRTADESHAFAKRLNEAGYDHFDMYTVMTRAFIALPPPSPNELQDVHYQDKLLDTIMTAQRKNADHTEQEFQRKSAECLQISEDANAKARQTRKATAEEQKSLKCSIGTPQSTPPVGVDIHKLLLGEEQ